MNSKLQLKSSIKKLEEGFQWAKKQAMEYVHDGEDPVGLWYEAALPMREAFCMRDVSHQSYGAAALGLGAHTENMLRRFAEYISGSRDYCTYWEITRENLPCKDDYEDDSDFWYNFPGSFEVIRACYQQCLWNEDSRYYQDEVFRKYYTWTCEKLVEYWDKDQDGILEHYPEYGRRGLASYNETDVAILTAGDMLASQYTGYDAYAHLLELDGKVQEAERYRKKSDDLKEKYLKQWYQPEKKEFYGAIKSNREFYEGYYKEGNFLPLFFGILQGEEKQKDAVEQLKKHGVENVEGMSYLPTIYYECGEEEVGWEILMKLCEPDLERREYPEVSFAVIGSIVNQLMGLKVEENGEIISCSRIQDTETAELEHISILGGEIHLSHEGKKGSVLENNTGKKRQWKACFEGEYKVLEVNGREIQAFQEEDGAGRQISWVNVLVENGERITVAVK